MYKQIQEDHLKFAEQLDIPDIQFVPISALEGDNVVGKMKRHHGLTARHFMLENIEIGEDDGLEDLRFPYNTLTALT